MSFSVIKELRYRSVPAKLKYILPQVYTLKEKLYTRKKIYRRADRNLTDNLSERYV